MGFDPGNTIQEVKTQIKDREGIPLDQQKLLFNGRELGDGQTLGGCNIQIQDTLHLLSLSEGGNNNYY